MTGSVEIHGFCESEFQPVREAFKQGFGSGLEIGASVAITRGEDAVVDLWAGFSDESKTSPWEEDSVTIVSSTTKIMTGLCAIMLID